MDEILEKIEVADEDTQKRFVNDFVKASKKKRRTIKKKQSRYLYLSNFIGIDASVLVAMVFSMVAILLSLYLPSLGEWYVGSLIELDADVAQSIMETCGCFRWIFRIVGFSGLVYSSTAIIKKLLRTMLFFG